MVSRENLTFICAACAGVVLLFALGLSRPDAFVEDGFVETLGAAGFAAASLLALALALRGVALTVTEKRLLLATSALALILFLSEISFGARIFQLQMPRMSGGGEFDGGHDIVIVIVRRLKDATPAGLLMAGAAAGLLLTVAAAFVFRFRRQARAIVRHVLSRPFEFRLAIAAGMLASAVTLDLITSHKASLLEETLEFSASAVLILAVAARLPANAMVRLAGHKTTAHRQR